VGLKHHTKLGFALCYIVLFFPYCIHSSALTNTYYMCIRIATLLVLAADLKDMAHYRYTLVGIYGSYADFEWSNVKQKTCMSVKTKDCNVEECCCCLLVNQAMDILGLQARLTRKIFDGMTRLSTLHKICHT